MPNKVKTKITIKKKTRRVGGNSGYKSCNMCHGTGRVKAGK